MKGDNAVLQRKQRVIAAPAYIRAGMYLCPALPYYYCSRLDACAAKNLNSQMLRIRIAAIFRPASAAFTCHNLSPIF
jgi:hypothetical protein